MIQLLEGKDLYLSSFAHFEKADRHQRSWVHPIRKAAIARFDELGFPTTKHEEWRTTNVAPLTRIAFKLADYESNGLAVEMLQRVAFPTDEGSRAVFVNGHYSPELSSVQGLPKGVIVGSLAEAIEKHRNWVEPHLARYADYREHTFRALNTALLHDGAFIYIPRSMVVEQPIHLVLISITRGERVMSHPRNLIVAGENSQATVVESYAGPEGEVYFTNIVTEIIAGENAVLDHYKVEQESTEAFHLATQQVHLDRSCNFTSHAILFGGGLVRNEVNAVLGGEGIECTLNGLYLAAGRQLIDNHTLIDHTKPHCASHELYKGILDGKAHGVFNGKILVRPGAQKTDAKQTNKALVLSDDAIINTEPQLKIYADDVKCTHGATVGQLDADALFYLRSRGISLEEAQNLLVFAFANDIVERIKVEPLRTQLEALLFASQRLSNGRPAKEAV